MEITDPGRIFRNRVYTVWLPLGVAFGLAASASALGMVWFDAIMASLPVLLFSSLFTSWVSGFRSAVVYLIAACALFGIGGALQYTGVTPAGLFVIAGLFAAVVLMKVHK